VAGKVKKRTVAILCVFPVTLMVSIVLASHAGFRCDKCLSLCPSESRSMIEANMGRALQSFNLNPNKPPTVSSIYTFPSLDLPHVESHLLISHLFCLSTSDPLFFFFTKVSEEDLSLTFKHSFLSSTSMSPLVCCISSSRILAPSFMHTITLSRLKKKRKHSTHVHEVMQHVIINSRASMHLT